MLSPSENRKTLSSHSKKIISTKTMEEVWKDINLASLNDHNTRPITTNSTFGGVILQDFLARPFNISSDPPNSNLVNSSSSASDYGTTPSPPVTALSLSSRPHQFHHFDPLGHNKQVSTVFVHPPNTHYSRMSCFDNITSCSSSLPCFGSKRFAEPADSSNLGDRRNKRMIKNRESAARSRARKQAYTNELQLKVDNLLEENARLRRQQQQLCEAAANQHKRKSSLYRTSTAPF